jgi:hypothetical protein
MEETEELELQTLEAPVRLVLRAEQVVLHLVEVLWVKLF